MGGKTQIGICCFAREKVNGRNKDKNYLGGPPIYWHIEKILAVSTSIYAFEIQDALLGFDTARSLKITLSELLLGNGNVDISTRIRYDNSSVVENVHPIKSVTKEHMANGFLASNKAALGDNPQLVISHIMGLCISDEMAKATTEIS